MLTLGIRTTLNIGEFARLGVSLVRGVRGRARVSSNQMQTQPTSTTSEVEMAHSTLSYYLGIKQRWLGRALC